MTEQPTGPTYALYASFAADPGRPLPEQERAQAAAQAQAALKSTVASLRGAYTLTGYRADADILLWLVGHSADAVQDALIAFRRTRLGQALRPVWSGIGVHREAEFRRRPTAKRRRSAEAYASVWSAIDVAPETDAGLGKAGADG